MADQVTEILTCIEQHGPISAHEVGKKTGWNRYVVDMVIKRLLEDGFVNQAGMTDVPPKWQEPTYQSIFHCPQCRAFMTKEP